jgi:ribonuclease Z
MELVFLGTGSMVPTKDRNVTGHVIDYKGEYLLVDCGEGTQRQMSVLGMSRSKVTKILLTHWHGDHVIGLVGLLQTMSAVENPGTVAIVGPPGTKTYLGHMLKSMHMDIRVTLDVHEVDAPNGPVRFFENGDYALEAANLDHGIPCLGYRFVEHDRRRMDLAKCAERGIKPGPLMGRLQEGESVETGGATVHPDDVSYVVPGRKLAFILDTELAANCIPLARDADILVCETTYKEDLATKGADHKHLTTRDAAAIATQAGVRRLIITHFSQRYRTTHELVEDARKYFPATDAAYDLMRVKL